jgi:hypothetical protein
VSKGSNLGLNVIMRLSHTLPTLSLLLALLFPLPGGGIPGTLHLKLRPPCRVNDSVAL